MKKILFTFYKYVGTHIHINISSKMVQYRKRYIHWFPLFKMKSMIRIYIILWLFICIPHCWFYYLIPIYFNQVFTFLLLNHTATMKMLWIVENSMCNWNYTLDFHMTCSLFVVSSMVVSTKLWLLLLKLASLIVFFAIQIIVAC